MDRPEDAKGAVVIRTMFGEVAAAEYFPDLSLDDMIRNEDWRKAVRAEGGPFCYTDLERRMPF
jgi:hypothetical protein